MIRALGCLSVRTTALSDCRYRECAARGRLLTARRRQVMLCAGRRPKAPNGRGPAELPYSPNVRAARRLGHSATASGGRGGGAKVAGRGTSCARGAGAGRAAWSRSALGSSPFRAEARGRPCSSPDSVSLSPPLRPAVLPSRRRLFLGEALFQRAGSMAAVETRVCETDGCSSEAKLQCPTCIKLGIQGSYFCSQECFKGSWATHKLLHKKAKDEKAKREVSSWTVEGDINTDPWAGYRYTGKLRPHYPLMPTRPVPSYIQRPDYADHPLGMSESEQALKGTSQIKLLSSEDIEGMRLVCRLAREVLDIAAGMIKPGVTTEEIDHAVHLACIARNCYPSPLNYYNFPKSCCTSVNEVICHGIPDRRPLQEGDIVNVDITLYRNGYHGDLNETFFVGDVDDGARKLVQTTYECLMQAIDAVKPGVRYRELGNIIQKHAQANGFSVVRSYCGHGIHKLFHTAPNVPHYASGWQDETWPDGWTAVTRDGKRSAQFEHTLLVTDTGCEILTRRLDSARPHFMSQF
uniref:Methionine aminopeptidase n=1 Tax=Papio anubis TaxID=9555 RepID=A0A8I5NEW9_PAPAN